MPNRYWVGGGGNWKDTPHWSESSGGAGGASVPNQSDDVFFDSNSSSGNFEVTFDQSSNKCLNLNLLPSSQMVFKGGSITIYANLNHNSNVIYQSTAGFMYINIGSDQSDTIRNFDNKYTGQTSDVIMSCNALLNLTSNVSLRSLTVRRMKTNNFNISISNTTTNSGRGLELLPPASQGAVELGTSTINITSNGSAFTRYTGSTLAVSAQNSTFNFQNTSSSSNYTISSADTFFGTVNINPGNSPGRYIITGSNSFSALNLGRNTNLFLGQSTQSPAVISVDNITAEGTDTERVSIQSALSGRQQIIRKTSGTVNLQYTNIRDNIANGGATFNSYRGSDLGNNSGWNFIGPTMPAANFTQDKTSGVRPLTVQFTDTSTGGEISSWSWNFGDSTGSSQQNPIKTYANAGTYTVSLTATNSIGSSTVTKSNLINATVLSYQSEAIGNIVLGGGSNPTAKFKREAKGNAIIGGGAYAVIKKNLDAVEEKKYIAKIYSDTGVYLETWSGDVISEVSFSQEINEIGSTVELELARNSDSLGQTTTNLTTEAGDPITTQAGDPIQVSVESRNQVGPGSTVIHNNRVDLYVYYGMTDILTTESGEPITTEDGEELLASVGAPNGLRVFTGFIAEISTKYGSTETTSVLLNSYGWDLDQYVLDNTLGATTLPYNSVDPSDIARQVMTRFAAVAEPGSYTKATTTSISTTGTIVSYTFKSNTYAEVLKKVLELMPSNWYFYVGLGDNTVYFRERATLPIHTFYLGKHIKDLDLRSYIGDSVNHVYFTGGNVAPEGEEQSSLYKQYKETPAPRTRRTLYNYSDNRVTLDSSADILSEGLIELKNKVQYRTTIEILTKQYDIETINVGDTVGFRNFGTETDQLIMQVIARTYTPDVVTLQLDTKPVTVNKRLEDVTRNLNIAENANLPSTPS